MSKNIFEEAVRLKLRFGTIKGSISVEDLYDLPLLHRTGADLDTVAKSLNKLVKESGEESFVVKKTTTNSVLELKLDIVKHVIETKLEEVEARERLRENKSKKERLMSLLADKEDEALKGKSAEEIKKLIEELE